MAEGRRPGRRAAAPAAPYGTRYEETAEERLRRRIEREETRHRRRTIEIAIGTCVLVLAVTPLALMALRPAPAPAQAETSAIAPPADNAVERDAVATTGVSAAEETGSVGATSAPRVAARPAPAAKPETRPRPKPKPKPTVASVQRYRIGIGTVGFDPERIVAKAGAPIELTVAKGEGCAAGFALPDLDILKDNSTGPVTVRIKAPKTGSYTYTCGMGMVTGTLVVR